MQPTSPVRPRHPVSPGLPSPKPATLGRGRLDPPATVTTAAEPFATEAIVTPALAGRPRTGCNRSTRGRRRAPVPSIPACTTQARPCNPLPSPPPRAAPRPLPALRSPPLRGAPRRAQWRRPRRRPVAHSIAGVAARRDTRLRQGGPGHRRVPRPQQPGRVHRDDTPSGDVDRPTAGVAARRDARLRQRGPGHRRVPPAPAARSCPPGRYAL